MYDDCEIYWYHTGLNGLPERVTDADGQAVWRGQFSTWSDTERELSVPQWQVPQNLRFQGQYLDRESGLHYNLFRYYDPVAGRYTQMDPIGLLGGINTYGYVPDPLTWVDPLGLCFSKRLGDFGESHAQSQLKASGNYADVFSVQNKSNNGIDLVGLRHDGKYLIPEELIKDPRYKVIFDRLKKIGWDGDGASNGIFLPGSEDLAKTIDMPGHWSNHRQYTGEVRKKLENVLRKESKLSDTQLALHVKDIQDWAREGLEKGIFNIDFNNGRLL